VHGDWQWVTGASCDPGLICFGPTPLERDLINNSNGVR
jgi:hypothetical protein